MKNSWIFLCWKLSESDILGRGRPSTRPHGRRTDVSEIFVRLMDGKRLYFGEDGRKWTVVKYTVLESIRSWKVYGLGVKYTVLDVNYTIFDEIYTVLSERYTVLLEKYTVFFLIRPYTFADHIVFEKRPYTFSSRTVYFQSGPYTLYDPPMFNKSNYFIQRLSFSESGLDFLSTNDASSVPKHVFSQKTGNSI